VSSGVARCAEEEEAEEEEEEEETPSLLLLLLLLLLPTQKKRTNGVRHAPSFLLLFSIVNVGARHRCSIHPIHEREERVTRTIT